MPTTSKSPNTSGSRLTNDGRSRITHKKHELPCSHESAESLSQSGDPACVCLLFSKCFVWFIWSTSCTCTNGLRFPRYIYIQDTLHSSKSKLESFNNLPQTKSTCDRKAKAPSWHALCFVLRAEERWQVQRCHRGATAGGQNPSKMYILLFMGVHC